MLTKNSLEFEIKEISEQGTFEGWASVYGVLDSYRDIVMPGAFSKTISGNNGEIVILNQHNQKDPVGLGMLEDRPKGLWLKGGLNLDLHSAQEAYSNVKKRILKGLSIGYTVRDGGEKFDKAKNANLLTDLDLMEVSLVTFQACPGALVASVKADGINTIRDFETFLRDAGFSQREAKALASHGYKALQRDADVSDVPAIDTAALADVVAALKAVNTDIKGALSTWKS